MLWRLLSVKPWHLSSCSLTWSPSSASSSPSSPTMASSTSSWRWNKHLTSALVSSQLLPNLRSDQKCSDLVQLFSQVSTNLVLTGLLSSYINSTARNSRSPQGRRRIRGFQVEWFVILSLFCKCNCLTIEVKCFNCLPFQLAGCLFLLLGSPLLAFLVIWIDSQSTSSSFAFLSFWLAIHCFCQLPSSKCQQSNEAWWF